MQGGLQIMRFSKPYKLAILLMISVLVISACEGSGSSQSADAAKGNSSTQDGIDSESSNGAVTVANAGIDAAIPNEIKEAEANIPFAMPDIKLPHFANKICKITDNGAVPDGITLNTDAINKTIAGCSQTGGGEVEIPSGTWLSGPIVMQSNINLHLDNGALLLFSPDRSVYAKSKALISGSGVNIAITGNGSINGNGEAWRPVKQGKVTADHWNRVLASGGASSNGVWAPTQGLLAGAEYRPFLLELSGTSILLDGIHLENSPSFALNLYNATDVVIRNTTVFNEYWAQNGDGLDLTSSQNVVLYNDTVNAGDDAITMKSSGSALENVVIANCTVYHGHGGFSVGSNTYGGIKNIYVHDTNYIGTDNGIHFKSYVGGGGTIENIYLNHIHMWDIVSNAIDFSSLYKGNNTKSEEAIIGDYRVPQFKNIHISNVVVNGAKNALNIEALPHIPLQNVEMDNMVIQSDQGVISDHADGITMKNVKILVKKGPLFTLKNSTNFKLDQIQFAANTKPFIQVGENTSGIQVTGTDLSKLQNPVEYASGSNKDAVTAK
jgi:hypothetical protein